MGQKLGSDALIYRNTGTEAVPSWSEITCLKDVTVSRPKTKVDASKRGTKRKKYLPGYADLEVSATLVHDEDDANFVAITGAYWDDTSIEIALCDGDITADGTKWQRVTVFVFDYSQNEPMDDELTYDITMAEDPDGTEYDIAEISES